MEWISSFIGWVSEGFQASKHLAEADFWLALLRDYKYWIVILGALLEGEMILLLAGGSAYHGYMSVHWVMIIAFLGALLHDHLLFFLGRAFGRKVLVRFPLWQGRVSKVSELIQKYDRWFIMSFRFVYGLRTITPLMVGNSEIPWRRYTILVCISAALWAVIVAYFGFTFAMALDVVMHDFDRYKKYLAIALGLLILGSVGIIQYRVYRKKHQK